VWVPLRHHVNQDTPPLQTFDGFLSQSEGKTRSQMAFKSLQWSSRAHNILCLTPLQSDRFPVTYSVLATLTFSMFFKHARYALAPGPLHLLFPLLDHSSITYPCTSPISYLEYLPKNHLFSETFLVWPTENCNPSTHILCVPLIFIHSIHHHGTFYVFYLFVLFLFFSQVYFSLFIIVALIP
jgi:hypothetical protein